SSLAQSADGEPTAEQVNAVRDAGAFGSIAGCWPRVVCGAGDI
ncbi:MAG: hypothetical protein BJ554DRAFT_3646, partial [Olpidium bornovanus]